MNLKRSEQRDINRQAFQLTQSYYHIIRDLLKAGRPPLSPADMQKALDLWHNLPVLFKTHEGLCQDVSNLRDVDVSDLGIDIVEAVESRLMALNEQMPWLEEERRRLLILTRRSDWAWALADGRCHEAGAEQNKKAVNGQSMSNKTPTAEELEIIANELNALATPYGYDISSRGGHPLLFYYGAALDWLTTWVHKRVSMCSLDELTDLQGYYDDALIAALVLKRIRGGIVRSRLLAELHGQISALAVVAREAATEEGK